MVSTQDSESCDPSSNLGRTWIFSKHCFSFFSGSACSNTANCKKNFFFPFHICDIQTVLIVFSSSTFVASKLYHWHLSSIWHLKMPIHFELSWLGLHQSIVGSVVECSPATRAARVRFPDDAVIFLFAYVFPHNFYQSDYLIPKGNKIREKKKLETGGIDPPTSHMLSERSTIWATSPASIGII